MPDSHSTLTEFDNFLAERPIPLKEDPFLWWKGRKSLYPNLARLARQVLAIPATSVPTEEINSTAGDIKTSTRNSLTPDHTEQLLFLHRNYDIIHKFHDHAPVSLNASMPTAETSESTQSCALDEEAPAQSLPQETTEDSEWVEDELESGHESFPLQRAVSFAQLILQMLTRLNCFFSHLSRNPIHILLPRTSLSLENFFTNFVL
jgi:hypothetical protein